jgi:hypothetical protein
MRDRNNKAIILPRGPYRPYVYRILAKVGMTNSNPNRTPMSTKYTPNKNDDKVNPDTIKPYLEYMG